MVKWLKALRAHKYRIVLAVVSVLLAMSLISVPTKAAIVLRAASVADNGGGSTTLPLSPPAGSVAGDVMVAFVGTRTNATITPPAGWTSQTKATSGTTLNGEVFTKAYSASDTTYTFTLSTSIRAAGVVVGYSGVDSVDPIDAKNSQANASSNPMMAANVTTTQPNTMLVAMYANIGANTFVSTAVSGMTMRGTTSSSGGGSGTSKITVGTQDATFSTPGTTVNKTMDGGATTVNIGAMVAIRPKPIIEQNSYRFFNNTDSTAPSTALAAINTPASIEKGTSFRLRLNIGANSGGSSITSAYSFNLQVGLKSSSCATASYTTISSGTSGVVSYDNASIADGATYVSGANDPTRSGVTAVGQYYDESNPMTIRTAIPSGQDGLWDISLAVNSSASYNATYCIRAVMPATTTLDTYTQYAEFTIPSPTVSQANYRWFANANNINPGVALASQDAVASVAAQTPIRLRQRLAVDGSGVPANYKNYKLQYAQKVSTCDPGVSGENYLDASGLPTNFSNHPAVTDITTDSSGTISWSGTSGDLQAVDALEIRASTKSNFGVYTNMAIAQGFGFNIPTSATINGIAVDATRRQQKVTLTAVNERSAKLVKNGVIGGSDLANTVRSWDTSQGGWGNSTELWGQSWTPSDINSPNFGFAFSVSLSSDNTNAIFAYVDDVTITVYFTDANGTAMVAYGTNSLVSSGSAINSIANDPTNASRSTIYQTYRSDDPFNNPSAIPKGSDGLWDFSLVPGASAAGKTLCFRVVDTGNGLLNSYAQYPQLTVSAISQQGPVLDQQLRGGQSYVSGAKGGFTW